jgi:hypothetical protein
MALRDTNARLAELASRCSALEASNKALRLDMAEDLESVIPAAQREIQDSVRDGVNGKDGVSIQGARGDKGIAGNVLTITAKDKRGIQQYARLIRKTIRERHANRLERLHKSLLETYGYSHNGLRTRLAELKSEIADLGGAE